MKFKFGDVVIIKQEGFYNGVAGQVVEGHKFGTLEPEYGVRLSCSFDIDPTFQYVRFLETELVKVVNNI